MSRPFGDDEEVLLVESGVNAFVNTLMTLVVAGGVLLVAIPRLLRGDWDMLILVFLAVTLVWLAFALNGRRLHLRGERFSSSGLARQDLGCADEFLGWERDIFGKLRLLRRRDLRWVPLTGTLHGNWPEPDVWRWLRTYVPGISPRGVREICRSTETSTSLLVHRIALPLETTGEGFFGSQRDIELASAARLVAGRRFSKARLALEELLTKLPSHSVALPFVLDALGSVGTHETATLLDRLRTRFHGDAAAHWARVYCRISSVSQLDTLRRLSTDPDWFIQRQAERALARLQSEAALAASPQR